MPKVSTFVYAERTSMVPSPNGDQKLIISGPLQVFTPPYIPGTFSFGVAFGILGADFNSEHSMRLVFNGPSNLKPIVDTGDLPIAKPKKWNQNVPPEMRGFFSSIMLQNVILKENGMYNSELFFDNESMGKFPIQVKESRPDDE